MEDLNFALAPEPIKGQKLADHELPDTIWQVSAHFWIYFQPFAAFTQLIDRLSRALGIRKEKPFPDLLEIRHGQISEFDPHRH